MKSRISIAKGTDAQRRTLEAVGLIGGVEKVVGKGDKVLIKPNMIGGLPPETGETTNPEVVKTMVEMVLNAGAKEALVGEGEPFVPIEVLRERFVNRPLSVSEPLYKRYEREIESVGGRIVSFNSWDEVKVPNPIFFETLKVAHLLLTCDVLIGVPALKTHHLAGITVALKNLYGAMPRESKHGYHRIDRVEEAIVDINQIRSSDMVVVDGTSTILHWGMVDQYLETHQLNLTLAGFDPVAVDATSSRILGMDPKSLRFLSWAEEKGLGTADLEKIETVGITVEEAYRGNMMTSVDYVNKKLSNIHLINCGACTGCFGRIATALHKVDDSKVEEDVYIVMGPKVKQADGVVFLCGNCAVPTFYNKLKGTFIPGCPPNLDPLLDNLKRLNAKV